MGKKIKKHKLVVIEQSRKCKVQHEDYVNNTIIIMCVYVRQAPD